MKAELLLVIHFHQPVGNFDNVIKRVYDNCYKPFLDIVSQYPEIKFNMHFSGCLLEWFEKNTPEVLDTIKKLTKRGQIEIMGGGFYEPILCVIPERDRSGQLAMMRDYIKSHFGREPRGAWIAERVWEPELVSSLSTNGVDYIVLDDMHFIYAGLKKEDTYGYFVSENNGSAVRVFPSDKQLRYIIPFSEPDRPISYMRGVAERKDGAIFTYGDDAEKFGEWPGTRKWVFEDKWLVRFFDMLLKNRDWLTTRTVSECLKDKLPLGRVYLPTASYEEMMEWALPVDASMALGDIKEELKRENRYERYSPFVRGGFFRNFFVKYEESNQMHKKMIYVSGLLEKAAKNSGYSPSKIAAARVELYKGQCNCSYWHGVFGGLYLYHLRKAVYEHLLRAEKICDESILKEKCLCNSETADFDSDGCEEVMLRNKDIWVCIKPSDGGTVVELDSKGASVNLLNVLTRRKEAYHRNITQKSEAGREERLSIHDQVKGSATVTVPTAYDKYRRAMFRDHFLSKGAGLENFEDMSYLEEGDFAASAYKFKAKKNEITMEKKALAYGLLTGIKKDIFLENSELTVSYRITNLGDSKRDFWFAVEIAFIMPEADSPRYTYNFPRAKNGEVLLSSRGKVENVVKTGVSDAKKQFGFILLFSKECDLWRFPIKTISQSEKDYEENYQGSVLAPNWRFSIEPNKSMDLKIKLEID